MSATAAPAGRLGRRSLLADRVRIGMIAYHAVILSGVAVLWHAALAGTSVGRISGFGLLAAFPLTFYAALALLAIGFASALSQRSCHRLLPVLYLVALVVVLHATTALLYSAPRYAWTYKHLGVTDYIAHYGRTDRSLDLYQNWPGFFAFAAMLQRATGASMLQIAPWAEVFFELAYLGGVVFVLRSLGSRGVVWTAAWLFELANWIGQDYYAPQSFAYVLYLVLIGLCIRCAGSPRAAPLRSRLAARWFALIERRRAGRTSPWHLSAPDAPLRPRSALLVGGLLFAAITTTHQLSPILCILAVTAFALTTRRISIRVIAAMLVVELAWLAVAWPLLAKKYSLLDFSPLDRPKPPGANAAWALPGYTTATLATRVSIAAVVALALAGLVIRHRRRIWDLPLVALIVLPALACVAQPYNGEGLLRAYLFALPWLTFLGASACEASGNVVRRTGRPQPAGAARGLAVLAASGVVGVTGVVSSFGRELINRITPQDVAIERWYEAHAPAGAVAFYLAPNVPNRITYRYANTQVWPGSFSPSLLDYPFLQGHPLSYADVPGLVRLLRGFGASRTYVMVGPSQTAYIQAVGALPPGSVTALQAAMLASGQFRIVARDGRAVLYELI